MFQKNTTLITETETADDMNAEIAIIGMAGRFPGADDVERFWQNLRDGVDGITDFSDEELLAAGVDPQTLQDPHYVKAGAVLGDIEGFDAAFFGMTPREAQVLDPQHRLFLETAWNVIESAGYDTATYKGAIGVFAGAAMSDYVLNNLFPNQELQETLGRGFTVLSNDKDALATRAAYFLDLTGPACSVQTYCSTSLVAVGLACDSLVNGESDMALAGGVALNVPQRVGYLYQEGGITSPDGRCRAFDANAQGSPLGSGVAVVLLKRLQDAVEDGDTIYAVIKGWAINNDGAMRTGFTAPGVRGQAKVVLEALAHAEVDAESIHYIEAHGTGTALGDAVEFAALVKSFGEHTNKKQFCAVGSVKTNIGHLDRAAGATGLIKTALALKNELIPPTLHYHTPNPEIDFSRTPFYVNTELRPWPRHGQPRRAGVSSFGMGGTNAHVILEEAPDVPVDDPSRPYQLMLLSARSQAALATAVSNLRTYLLANPDVNMADVAYTLQVGRKPFEYRRAFICQGREDALRILESGDPARSWEWAQVTQERPFAFMFPGVGDHYPHMAQELYEVEPVFRQVVDDCCQQLQPILGLDLRDLLFPPLTAPATDSELNLRQMLGRQKSSDERLNRTEFAQPAVFVIEYALSQLLRSWGITPGALIGYSLGEYVAACVAGVLPLAAALLLVARRAQLIQQLPTGSMLAVSLSEAAVRPYVQDPICLAIVNGPQNCVLAGPTAALQQVEQQLAAQEIACRRLETSHAFHSTMMTPIVAEFTALVRSISLSPPQIPYLSNVTGDWITAEQATDPAYWAQHLCQTVRFGDGLGRLLANRQQLLLEVGPGQSLASFAKQHPDCTREQFSQILPTLPYVYNRRSDVAFLLSTAAKVWLQGHPLAWAGFYGDERRQRIPLPTYPFERQRYWIDPPAVPQATPPLPAASTGKKADSADWFYEPVWQAVPLPVQSGKLHGRCLIFADESGWGTAVGAALHQQGCQVVYATMGQTFAQNAADQFTLRPDVAADYDALLQALQDTGELPEHVIHAWGIGQTDPTLSAREMFQAAQQKGFYSLLYLAQTLSRQPRSSFQVTVLTSNMQAVDDSLVCPEKATVLSLCRVIPQEYQNIRCRSVDVALTAVNGDIPETTITHLLAECANPATEIAVAYRQDTRYVQQFVAKRPQPVIERLRRNGVYLITGGLGGIGLTLADYLARHYQATLILLGRAGLPAPETWDTWLAEHGADDSTSRRIQQVRALQANGAEVLVLAADVADEGQMRAVIDEIYARYGRLHGVIHAAGYVSRTAFAPLQETDPTLCEAHFQSKVHGLYVLDKVLQNRELDFYCLFSSLSSVLGGLGVAAYAAANTFMDAYAAQRRQVGAANWLTVNWDTWLVNEMEMAGLVGGTVAEFAMSPAEGVKAFALALASGQAYLVHSTGDLHGRIRQWVLLEALTAVSRPAQNATRPALTSGYTAAGKGIEKRIGGVWEEVLGIEGIGIHDNFFDLGGNSLIGLQVVARLQKELGMPVSAVALFEAPTISSLARYLQPESEPEENETASERERYQQRRQQARQQVGQEGIAIVSMTGRFPGAESVTAFWDNLRQGVESITFFSEAELLAAGVPAELVHDPAYVPARPVLAHPAHFDASFFGYSPREAELLDPQHRHFLQCAWEGLELAGYDPERYGGLIGVFAGANFSSYLLSWFADPALAQTITPFQAGISNDKDSLTTRVSYKLNLRGPSLAVQTFCSTSLVAVHMACQSLLAGECDMALAGGVSISVPTIQGHLYQEGDQVSPDGHCRSFDAAAAGTVFGDGVGVVVLKRLSEALADGDPIQAVIKGSAINNDGSLKVGYTAPSIVGQSEAILEAWARAGIAPESIGYIEAHGTATELGDPVEVTSLTQAFRRHTAARGFCALGSVKTNLGHLNQAAGVTGLIKAALAVQQGEIPATLHFQSPNPALNLPESPFYINTERQVWPGNGRPRRAGVNSLGVGGTNAHVVLEEPPSRPPSGASRPYQLLLLSARSSEGLEQMTHNLADYLRRQPRQQPEVKLADVAYTLQVGRREFAHRRMVVCRDVAAAQYALEAQPPQQVFSHYQPDVSRTVAFLFPGVGDQYVGMGRELYTHEPLFRQVVEECCAVLRPYLGERIRDLLYPAEVETPKQMNGHNGHNGHNLRAMLGQTCAVDSPAARRLQETAVAQPVQFVMAYALARLLMSWGVRPSAMVGYSLGEYVAACLAGVMSLKDALKLVAERAQLIAALPPGRMLAVTLSPAEAQPYLNENITIAIHNGVHSCVLAGTPEAMAQVKAQLDAAGIANQMLATSHAFHSPMMAGAQRPLTELAQSIRLQPPRIPYLSNVTGAWITDEQATDPAYWAAQMCQPVQFYTAIEQLLENEEQILIEVGPGQALGSFVRQHPACGREQMGLILPTLPYAHQQQPDLAFLLETLGKLWLLGTAVHWPGFYQHEQRHRLPLPTYPFQPASFWLQGKSLAMATSASANGATQTQGDSLAEKINQSPRQEVSDWFYLPGWKQIGPPDPQTAVLKTGPNDCWLLFADTFGVAETIADWLAAQGQTVAWVQSGDGFSAMAPNRFAVRPTVREDYTAVLQELRRQGLSPARVVHLWTLADDDNLPTDQALAQTLDLGFYSLMSLTQAIDDTGVETCDISIITSHAQAVNSHERPRPEKATVIGPCRVIPQEYDNIQSRCIDVTLPAPGSWQAETFTSNLLGLLTAEVNDRLLALRDQQCWVQCFEPVHLPPTTPQKPVLRPSGVYLITGGLGGIGLAVAEHLAQNQQARLILVSRTGLPPRSEWERIMAREPGTAVAHKIARLQQIEATGAEVLVAAADVSDVGQMTAVVQQAIARFGVIHGVFHTAGLPGMGLIQLKTADQVEPVLAPKVQGTLVLEQVLADVELDFLALFSSITSVTGGGPGQIDYCAANAFMDAYAQSQVGRQRLTIAIDWGEWQWNAWESGLDGFGEKARTFFKENRQRFGISFVEGNQAIERILSRRLPQVIVSTQDFCQFTELAKQFTISRLLGWERGESETQTRHPRPVLGTSYTAPSNEREQQIADIWGDLLGVAEIGIHDNFFDLGGNSLIGLDLVRRLQKATGRDDIPARIIYEAPTVATLAAYLNQENDSQAVMDQRLSRGERRRQQSQQRKQMTRMRGN